VSESPAITVLLQRAHRGDAAALDAVTRAVQSDLEGHARRLLAGHRGPRDRPVTLEPRDLVQETFLKLLEQRNEYQNRQHFFAIATRVMLRALIDYHKTHGRQKRFGGQVRVSLSALDARGADPPITAVPDLVAALEELERMDPRLAEAVQLRALWGMTALEAADVLGVSRATVDRDWRFARAWLATRLAGKSKPLP
jgi:RNA polymerase sigma factor (TIGR02999 family)